MILSAQADFQIVGEAANGREVLELAEKLQPDVVIMDVTMPELNGIEATRRLTGVAPRARVLALSMHKDAVYVREILRAGARGYLLKDSADADLIAAVRAVAKGEAWLTTRRFGRGADRLSAPRHRSARSAHHPREREV